MEIDTVVSDWLRSTPELETRPELVRCMLRDPALRRRVLRLAERLTSLGHKLRGYDFASNVLELVNNECKASATKLEARLPTANSKAELQGFLRNVYLNMRFRATGVDYQRRLRTTDVLRDDYDDGKEEDQSQAPASSQSEAEES